MHWPGSKARELDRDQHSVKPRLGVVQPDQHAGLENAGLNPAARARRLPALLGHDPRSTHLLPLPHYCIAS